MSAAFVQRVVSATTATSATTQVLTLAATTTAGNTVIMAMKTNASFTVSSVVDSKGNTWAVDKTTTNASSARLAICHAYLTTALVTGDTITVTLSGSATHSTAVYEYSGIASTTPVDGTGVGSQGNTATSGATGNYTSTHPDDLIFTAIATGSGSAYVAPAGFTERPSGQTAVDAAGQIVAATGTFNPSWSWTTSSNYGVAVVGYKAVTASGGGPKVFVGGVWTPKPAKVYVGGVWVQKPLKRWNGSAWVTV